MTHAAGAAMIQGMARSPYNSPLVEFAWTDAVIGNRRSTFYPNDPIELRFGLSFGPDFFTSFNTAQYFFFVRTKARGAQVNRWQFDDSTTLLPGGTASEQWIGVHLGAARQVSSANDSTVPGVASVSAELWILRQGGSSHSTSQWAVTPHEQGLFIEQFDNTATNPIGIASMSFIGGAGTPPGSPAS